MNRSLIIFSISLLFLSGCANKHSVRVTGNVKGSSSKMIYLNRIDVDTYIRIDSAAIRKNGNFRFRFKAAEPDFYQVGFSDKNFITLLAEPGEKILLTFPEDKLYENYMVRGSPGTSKIKMLDSVLAVTRGKLDSLQVVFDKESKGPEFASREPVLKQEYLDLVKKQRKKNIEFILGNLSSFASIKALYQMIDNNNYVLYDPRDLQFVKLVSDSLNFHYPKSKQAISLKENFERELGQMNLRKLEQAARNAPEIKLNPNLKDLKGKRIALSSLKGKIVLLCFWATGSDECISENLELKDLYKTYKPKGFEIYQINLDENEAVWKRAVQFDELPWINVREDDPGNPANAILYNVRAVPANYLYDRNGVIIATNLHGQNLRIKLGQIFGK